jgi:hypothetical protein
LVAVVAPAALVPLAGEFAAAGNIDIFGAGPEEAEMAGLDTTPTPREGAADSVLEPKCVLSCELEVELLFNCTIKRIALNQFRGRFISVVKQIIILKKLSYNYPANKR